MRTVAAFGPRNAEVTIVGEAPGVEEVRKGEPFVGPSGRLLTSQLDAAGILKETCFITNVIKEHPPNNDIDFFIDLSKKEPKISVKAEDYLGQLNADLDEVRSKIIIAVGNTALWALTGKKGITKHRGSVYERHLQDGKVQYIIPIIHPAAILRGTKYGGGLSINNPYFYHYYSRHDLAKAKSILDGTAKYKMRHYKVCRTYAEAMEAIDDCSLYGRIGFDLEASMVTRKMLCLSLSPDPTLSYVIPFWGPNGHVFSEAEEASIIARLSLKLLSNREIEKIAHNAAFDCGFFARNYGIFPFPVFDTMLAMKMITPDFPKSLDFGVSIYIDDMNYYKMDGKENMTEHAIDFENFWIYNGKDSIVLHEILDKTMHALALQGNLWSYLTQNSMLAPLVDMQYTGVKMDMQALQGLGAKCSRNLDDLQKRINQTIGYKINAASSKQKQAHFYDKLKIKPYLHRKTKKPTMDVTALKRLIRRGYKEADLMMQFSKEFKLKTSYADLEVSADDRLRGQISPITSTGRYSCSDLMGEGANMENLPPVIDRMLYGDNHSIPFSIDLSNADNRSVAYIAPEPRMIEAFEKGVDIHSQTFASMYKIPIEEVSRKNGSSPLGDGSKSQRFWGKKTGHSLNYNLGADNFSLDAELEQTDGRRLVELYHSIYPNLRNVYYPWIHEQLRKDRTLTNSYGVKRKFYGDFNQTMFNAAYGGIPQSNTAYTINIKGVLFIHHRYNYDTVMLLNQIHDSVWFQISKRLPWPVIKEILWEIKASLETPLEWKNYRFSIPAEIKVGQCFGCMKETNIDDVEEVYTKTEEERLAKV